MNDTKMEVLVFKTDIIAKVDRENLAQILTNDHRIRNWNIDQDDIDNVLRIESTEMCPTDVIELVKKLGYQCEELPD